MNPLTLYTCECVAEVSEEKFRNSMVIYEIYETFPLRNFLRIRYLVMTSLKIDAPHVGRMMVYRPR